MIPTPERVATNGMVASVNHLASEAGVAMLRAGGSAADAAIAASAVLAVTDQHLCGMGGDLFAVVAGAGASPVVLNASGRAGSGASAQQLRDEGHAVMPFRDDIRSVTIPGCVDGWIALHARFGRLPLSAVLGPAVTYAEDGFVPSYTGAMTRSFMSTLPGGGDYAGDGQTMRRPAVAATLRAIGADGREAFYGGEFGEGLLALGDGLYEADDLKVVQATWQDAVVVDAFGHRIWGAPPNSQAYLALASAWIADGLDLPSDPDDPMWAHLLVEASRQAAFDRLAFLHEDADAAAFLEGLDARRSAIDPNRAATLGDSYTSGGTMCLTAVDRFRTGVTLIQSNASGWGSNLVEPNTLIFLHNRGTGFSLQPGHPAEFAPGRRPPHTLSPLAVTHADGSLRMSIGTMGGDSQPQILLQLLVRMLRHNEPAHRAVSAGRFALHSQDNPSTGFDTWDNRGRVKVRLEANAPAAWADGLRQRGHEVEHAPAFNASFGHAHIVDVDGDVLIGGADPRSRSGSASGY
ncbi:MAG: gamma-glutamyltransferase [Acidimicrobiales bacterium]|nr:gamma-glutamyltransferase [Acidimicrobiales bacterium]